MLGIDGTDEVLSMLYGEPAFTPWPEALRSSHGVGELGRWLREYHDAVRTFRPPVDARWQGQEEDWQPGMVIRHGDLGPWNSIWDEGQLIGFIDWDFAAPGHAIDDLAQLAWYAVPLRPMEQQQRASVTGSSTLQARLHTLCTAYGEQPLAVVEALDALQSREAARIERLGRQGTEPWATFLVRGDADEMLAEQRWIRSESDALLGTGRKWKPSPAVDH
ncbi:phosphotransferase [Streptomyces aureus]